jgi:hypothetical protein
MVGALALAGCQAPSPSSVTASLAPTPAFNTRSPAEVAVLPVEDGTPDGAAQRHLTLLRQEVMRQMVDRLFAPLTAGSVDAALKSAPPVAPGESMLVPATLQKLAGHAGEQATFALRIDQWDERLLQVDRKLRFQFQAALVGSDGVLLWGGTLQGEVKAGGVGPAPLDREGMARSCIEIAVRELLQRLPRRVV